MTNWKQWVTVAAVAGAVFWAFCVGETAGGEHMRVKAELAVYEAAYTDAASGMGDTQACSSTNSLWQSSSTTTVWMRCGDPVMSAEASKAYARVVHQVQP